ncbi:hypothetical protein O2W15_13815 [Modestobacter sp. VKM Ac-2979]|uniref:hypothetical protein n=1 Tax=unclassified Modestobacter TaxID=2643866 RepID=UPI0022ABC5AA|nr:MULTISPECIES: hypothetical protein [unclassified Modestobacter]MCZ2812511.1 hypothetical protein [Modestobacter sp. VKM Ac-2979]MCZ2841401.1 hypothetical protein [Modestobacter sp. VKM Ac-2980]
MSGTRATGDAPWDLSFLRIGLLVTAVATAVAAVAVGVALTWADALTVVIGATVVTAFFCVSGLVVAWAGKVDDTWTMPAALGTFGLKALVLFPLLTGLPADGWPDRQVLAWTVVAGALLWSGVQLRWVWTRQLFYVPPPTPPGERRHSPENPAPRG